MNKTGILLRCSFLFLCLLAFIPGYGQVNLPLNSTFRYLKGSQASGLPANWNMPGYADASWTQSAAPFRYGVGTGGTALSDMQGNYTTVYLRGTFTATNASKIEELCITAYFDDGFIIWINGEPVASGNAPANTSSTALATALHDYSTPVTYKVYTSDFQLLEGANTIAIQGFNFTKVSSDFFLNLGITGVVALPRVEVKPVLSQASGFYTSNFSLSISSPVAGYSLRYTLDGSNPAESPTAVLAAPPVNVSINPGSTTGRDATPAVVVRASLVKAGYRSSFPVAATYIFPSKVKTQTSPGGRWPTGDVNGQWLDFDMDPNVTNDVRYSPLITTSLKAIPTISVVTDIASLFDAYTGIYVNADGHGEEWERECTAELINPDGTAGFNVNAGLRIRGGYSRHGNYPKHAFRLFFKSRYGTSKLQFPLFETEGTSKFDKIDLRCEQNYSWSNGSGQYNSFVRDVFSRDLQGDMGDPYTRSRYYHLYLNGMYWGLYQTQERSEASFAASYFGGKDADYDVVKVSTENWVYDVEATDGYLDAWREVWNLCQKGFSGAANYNLLQGKDETGKPIPGAPVLVDIDNLIDYMLVIFYTGNFDSPTSSFMGNNGCNNFFAIYNRKNPIDGFRFFAHDAEHSLMDEAISPGVGLYEDRVNLSMGMPGFEKFHPQWLHDKLSDNAEYRIRFADRAYQLLLPGNALSPENCTARLNKRVGQVTGAVIAESARWGDTQHYPAYTFDEGWKQQIEAIRTIFFPARSNILISQLKTANLYLLVSAPVIKTGNTVINLDTLTFATSLPVSISNPTVNGFIYYTTNGEDPRLVGGAINSKAVKATGSKALTLTSTTPVKARINFNGSWSPLASINFLKKNEDYSGLRVTELMYHPPDFVDGLDTTFGTSLEFVEFKNIGTNWLNLSGMKLLGGISGTFPFNSLLGPGEFFVAASKINPFHYHYSKTASANLSGNLSNSGELIVLADPAGNPVISFTYSDLSPWPLEPDGAGYSLAAVQSKPQGDPNYSSYWKTSSTLKGSPFADDELAADVLTDELGARVEVYPNPASDLFYIQGINTQGMREVSVEIIDLDGRVLLERMNYKGESISLSSAGLKPGLYLVKINSGASMQVKKLVYAPASW